jgi:hypothetical protein
MGKYTAELIRRLESGEPRHETKSWFINCWNDPDFTDDTPLEQAFVQEINDDCTEAMKQMREQRVREERTANSTVMEPNMNDTTPTLQQQTPATTLTPDHLLRGMATLEELQGFLQRLKKDQPRKQLVENALTSVQLTPYNRGINSFEHQVDALKIIASAFVPNESLPF